MQMPRWAAIPRNLSISLGDEELSERMRMAHESATVPGELKIEVKDV